MRTKYELLGLTNEHNYMQHFHDPDDLPNIIELLNDGLLIKKALFGVIEYYVITGLGREFMKAHEVTK